MRDTVRQYRVAVIDDDAGFAMSMAALLGSDGFDVRLFDSAESFIAADETPRFRCLLVDWLLPGMSGATLCERVAALDRPPALILMSGTQFVDDRLPRQLAPDVEFVQKPFDPEWLLDELATICNRPQ
ncbi:response regulator [Salinisphaera hydrothermalis]|uniref:response regulator n=1 Tax=Salinisphaera hydrothermalis TaxID=563188 RepID=UPI00333E1DB5